MLFLFKSSNRPKVIFESFYFWKNTLAENTLDTNLLNELKVKKLYIKLFDIGWREGEGVLPISSLAGDIRLIPSYIELVPTVFITNEAFIKTPKSDIQILSRNVFNSLKHYFDESLPASKSLSNEKQDKLDFNRFSKVKEIQIDCDWSEKTREKYFQLLKNLKTFLPDSVKISVTIRLHQVKYRAKTGVPPVDKGMLMMYNILNPTEFNERNSIFDEKEARSYLKNQKAYPLTLDLALPLFSWAITYRHNKFFELLNGVTRYEADNAKWLEKNNRFYMFNRDTVLQNHYFRMGDLLKIEDVTPSVLRTCTELARPIIGNDTLNISFFHFDSNLIHDITPTVIQKVYKTWR